MPNQHPRNASCLIAILSVLGVLTSDLPSLSADEPHPELDRLQISGKYGKVELVAICWGPADKGRWFPIRWPNES